MVGERSVTSRLHNRRGWLDLNLKRSEAGIMDKMDRAKLFRNVVAAGVAARPMQRTTLPPKRQRPLAHEEPC